MVERGGRGGGGCPQGRSREYKGCKGGGRQGRWICVCSKSMGGAMMGLCYPCVENHAF